MYVTVVLLLLVGTLLYRWYQNRKERFEIFKTIGINGPEPNIFFGNLAEMKDVGQHKKWMDWRQKYGKTYGYFEGPKPVLVTSDVDLIQQIMIKEFSKFHSRKPFPLHDKDDKFLDMFGATGQHWKRIRAICSPSFSTRRLKEMSPLIHQSITELLGVLGARADEGKPFDIYGEFQRLTLSVIASTAFGIEVNAIRNPQDVFLLQARKIFEITEEKKRNWAMTLFIPAAICFPENFHKAWHYINPYITLPRTWFLVSAKKILQERMKTTSDRVDFVQLMLDAQLTDEPLDLTMTADENEAEETAHVQTETLKERPEESSSRSNRKKLTMEEMQSQCMLFLLAGYETTSTALGFTCHSLAMNPDVHDKLISEIDEHYPDKNCLPDYDSLKKLPYLDMVLSEVLRMYPIAAIATTRQAMEDCVLNGRTIKKGMMVQANMEDVHFDPDLWGPEDPHQFVPERFLPERRSARHPCAWMPFGVGPRNCVGMRFALLETKLALVRLLQHYTVHRTDETRDPLPVNNVAVRAPSEGVYVRLAKRE